MRIREMNEGLYRREIRERIKVLFDQLEGDGGAP
jgi:hypothetical protein